MVALTFPDGARREYTEKTSGLYIAKSISPSLAKRKVAMALDGKLADLSDSIEHDAKIEFLTRDDPRALELIRGGGGLDPPAALEAAKQDRS